MNIKELVRPNILALKPYTSARQSHLTGILLDANENSYGSVADNYESLQLNRYPDPSQKILREKLSSIINVPMENLFFGVGSDEIIDLLIRIFCKPGIDNTIICEPTYGMFHVSCDVNDVRVKDVPLTENFQPDVNKIISAVDENTKILFLCSPNNPTGNSFDKNKILELIRELKIIVLVDEAYFDFAGDEGFAKYVNEFPNLVAMRTFSKAWGLAGARCGYCAASQEVIDLLFKVKAPYNMNKLSANAVIKAMNNLGKRNEFVDKIIAERKRVETALNSNKEVKNVLSSDSNFISFKVDEPKKVFVYLEKNGVVIRDRSNQYNFDGYLRVTIGTEAENNLFLQKLGEIL